MANTLDIDLTGKVVVFKQHFLTVPATEHPFLVKGGFGAKPHTMGRALGGVFLKQASDRIAQSGAGEPPVLADGVGGPDERALDREGLDRPLEA